MRQLFFILLSFIIVLTNCEKWDLPHDSFPAIITGNAEVQDSLLIASVSGEIKGLLEQERVENHGHLWTDKEDDLLKLPHPNRTSFEKIGNSTFTSELENLKVGQTYYYRAYALIGNEVFYGEVKNFYISSLMTTAKIDSIVVHERTSTLIESIKIYITYVNLPIGLDMEDAGIVMSKQFNPNIFDHFSEGTGFFTSSNSTLSFTLIPQVDINEDHYFRPYLIVDGQVYYGEEILFNVVDIWLPKTDFEGVPISRSIGFSIENKGYVGIGWDSDPKATPYFWEYDPILDQWTQKADFAGGERVNAVGFSIGNKGYIGTGTDIGYYEKTDFWEYDPSIDQWIQKADFAGGPRHGAIGFSIGNKGFIGTGVYWDYHGTGTGTYKTDFWEYDPILDQWTEKADFTVMNTSAAVSFSIGNYGYIGTRSGSFWKYDPNIDQWTPKANFEGEGRSSAVGFSIGNLGYLGTGSDGEWKSDFWNYDPNTDQWNQKSDFPGGARTNAIGFSIGNKGYIGTGDDIDFNKINDLWEYSPE